jgi:hypothetical protein
MTTIEEETNNTSYIHLERSTLVNNLGGSSELAFTVKSPRDPSYPNFARH